MPFWSETPAYWMQKTGTGPLGLSQQEAAERHKATLKQKQVRSPYWQMASLFFRQFTHPLMLMLLVAVLISAFLREVTDAAIVFLIILSAGLVGFYQELRALRVVSTLNNLLSPETTVLRDGHLVNLPSREVVRGDLIELNAGDMIPADCLLVEAKELHADESSLTGESAPARKVPGQTDKDAPLLKRTNCLWKGTHIVSGTGRALVINEGHASLFGQIVESVSHHVESSFELGLKSFGFLLMRLTLLLTLFVWVATMADGKPLLTASLFALALGVGMAPELLPAITTIAMSSGARKLLARKVIVKSLPSIQNLGEVNLLCTDKTGTITTGKMEISDIVDASGIANPLARRFAFINARLQTGYTNPIDEALCRLEGIDIAAVEKTDEIPYDFNRKRLTVIVRDGQKQWLITKGAFAGMLPLCSKILLPDGSTEPLTKQNTELQSRFDAFGQAGFRVLALAFRPIENAGLVDENAEADLIFAGFILMHDDLRPGVAETIEKLTGLEVGLKVITGDNKKIALATARQMGFADPLVITGQEMMAIPESEIDQRLAAVQVFAEVEPQQKEWIITQLRRTYKVAYLGDGINDVPALHAADIGISVNNAADVARDAADVVLTEKNLDVVITGIREGRKTFANTLKYIHISTGSTIGNMMSVALASIFLPFLPMLPKQILLTNFLSDIPYIFIASDEVDKEQIQKPGIWHMQGIKKSMLFFGLHSSLFDMLSFCVLKFIWDASEPVFQTAWFVESVLTELMILFILRTKMPFLKSRPAKGLLITALAGVMITILLPYLSLEKFAGLVALPPQIMLSICGIAALYMATAEWVKRQVWQG